MFIFTLYQKLEFMRILIFVRAVITSLILVTATVENSIVFLNAHVHIDIQSALPFLCWLFCTFIQCCQIKGRSNWVIEKPILKSIPIAITCLLSSTQKGLALKNKPAVLVLALVSKTGDLKSRRAAFNTLSRVCRIPTDLFYFLSVMKVLGGQESLQKNTFQNGILKKTSQSSLIIWANTDQQKNGDIKMYFDQQMQSDHARNVLFK